MNLQDQTDRDQAETVACPDKPRGCGRPAGTACRNLSTGEPLEHLPAHAARLAAAGVVHAPLDSRELSRDPDRRPRGEWTSR